MKGQTFTDKYLKWVKENTVETLLPTGWTAIATPFLDSHNDGLTIYAKEERGEITFSDDGYIIGDLEFIGVSTSHRMKTLKRFLQGYGVTVTDDKELEIKATAHNAPVKQHLLLQAMMAVSDMFTPTQSTKGGELFLDKVVKFFDGNGVVYTPDAQFQGKSGLIHKVDFVIPHWKNLPERFVYAINNPNKGTAKNAIFTWEDISSNRTQKNQLISVLHDQRKIPDEITTMFVNYDAIPIPWSKRDENVSALTVA